MTDDSQSATPPLPSKPPVANAKEIAEAALAEATSMGALAAISMVIASDGTWYMASVGNSYMLRTLVDLGTETCIKQLDQLMRAPT